MKAASIIFAFSLVFIVFIIGCEEKNIPPTCEIISPSKEVEYYVGDTITISVEAEDEDGIIAEVRFYIDDIGVASASTFPFNFEWVTKGEDDGSKDIKVTVKDDKGGSAQDETSIILNPKGEPPVASFTADTTWVTEGKSIQFTDQSTNEPTEWQWNFGDGNTSTDQNPTHTYTTVGKYTVELKAINHFGFDYESKTHFIYVNKSIETGTFTDARDGKTYNLVNIGTQVWMAENLNTSKYNDGTDIPLVTDDNAWANLADNNSYDAFCYYNNNTSSEYGALYTYAAALNACPPGWHLPSVAEWNELTDYLGGTSVAGGKLKETGTTHWNSPNTGATNESGFTALPGGIRGNNGTFKSAGKRSTWWLDRGNITGYVATLQNLSYSESGFFTDYVYMSDGLSVRCVRDDVRTDDD